MSATSDPTPTSCTQSDEPGSYWPLSGLEIAREWLALAYGPERTTHPNEVDLSDGTWVHNLCSVDLDYVVAHCLRVCTRSVRDVPTMVDYLFVWNGPPVGDGVTAFVDLERQTKAEWLNEPRAFFEQAPPHRAMERFLTWLADVELSTTE